MTVDEERNRALNFAVAAFLGALAIGLLTAIPSEDEFTHRLDEIVVAIVVGAFLFWYFAGRNKYSRSTIPLGAIGIVLVIKAVALFVLEFNDVQDRGDDIGISVVVLAYLAIMTWNYVRSPAASTRD